MFSFLGYNKDTSNSHIPTVQPAFNSNIPLNQRIDVQLHVNSWKQKRQHDLQLFLTPHMNALMKIYHSILLGGNISFALLCLFAYVLLLKFVVQSAIFFAVSLWVGYTLYNTIILPADWAIWLSRKIDTVIGAIVMILYFSIHRLYRPVF